MFKGGTLSTNSYGMTLNSAVEALNLLREYETNSITKFTCYSSDKGFGKIGKFNIWRGEKGIIFQKNPIIKRSLKNGCSKNLGKLRGNKQSKRSFLAKSHVKSRYLNERDSLAANLLQKNSHLELFFKTLKVSEQLFLENMLMAISEF